MIRDAIDREVEAVDSGESCCCVDVKFPHFGSNLPSAALLSCPRAALVHPVDNHHLLLCFCASFCLAEYQLAKPSDSHRKEMLFGSLAKTGHPMGKFCWGELVNTTTGTHNTPRSSLGYFQQEQTAVLRQLPSLLFLPLFLHF